MARTDRPPLRLRRRALDRLVSRELRALRAPAQRDLFSPLAELQGSHRPPVAAGGEPLLRLLERCEP